MTLTFLISHPKFQAFLRAPPGAKNKCAPPRPPSGIKMAVIWIVQPAAHVPNNASSDIPHRGEGPMRHLLGGAVVSVFFEKFLSNLHAICPENDCLITNKCQRETFTFPLLSAHNILTARKKDVKERK